MILGSKVHQWLDLRIHLFFDTHYIHTMILCTIVGFFIPYLGICTLVYHWCLVSRLRLAEKFVKFRLVATKLYLCQNYIYRSYLS